MQLSSRSAVAYVPAPMLARLARVVLWAVALSAILTFLGLAVWRLGYPLELDYIEGVMMDHVVRLAAGRPIYVAPTLEFITLAYMPGFATLSSLLVRVVGAHFWVPRLVSLLAMTGLITLVILTVRAETRRWTWGVAGAAILTMSYGVTGGHYDVGRPDSLMLFLAVAGLVTLRFTTSVRGAVAAALLLTAAFFTKQHAVWFGIAGLAHLAVNDRARLRPFAATLIAGCAGGYLLLSLWLGPWFRFYTWEIPTRWSELSRARIVAYVGQGLLGSHALVVLPAILALGLAPAPWRGREGLWMFAGLAGIATGFMATLDPDAFRHVMNPTVAAFSILGPVALARLVREFVPAAREPGSPVPPIAAFIVCLLSVPLLYPVRAHFPHRGGAEAHAALLDTLRRHPGPVLVLYHGFYAWQAGKGTSLHQITLDDIVRAKGNSLLERDPLYFHRLFEPLRNGRDRPLILTDVRLDHSGSESRPLWREVAKHYRLAGELPRSIEIAANPVTGNHWTPRFLYAPLGPGESAPPDTASTDPGPPE